MLQTVSPRSSNYSLRHSINTDSGPQLGGDMADDDYDDEVDQDNVKGRSKSRRELPAGAVATLKSWLLSPEHFTHPYPTPQDQAMLMQKTGIDKKQLKNWFTNARRRIWKPMLKKQIEQGKLTGGGGIPGLMLTSIPGTAGTAVNGSMENPHSIQAMRVHYQQAMQQGTNPVGVQESTSTETYVSGAPSSMAAVVPAPPGQSKTAEKVQSIQQQQTSSSMGTLPQLSSSTQLSKTDSHAVLMELFARDQDLVKQATESARLKAEAKASSSQPARALVRVAGQYQKSSSILAPQHPMKTPSQGVLPTVPTLNSWPHFSSITSLNNLGTMPGVKSITSLSGADLASKGGVNKMGNLAQVKSMDSIGRNDSYAFLEVFFGEKSSGNLSGMDSCKDANGKAGRPTGENDDNEEIGLSLEDDSPSNQAPRKELTSATLSSASTPATPSCLQESAMDSRTLKRAYDDALAARGLIAVSRSCEKLPELPAKIQRTLSSQEFINKPRMPIQHHIFHEKTRSSGCLVSRNGESSNQHPGEEPGGQSGTAGSDVQIHVPATTKCAICHETNVDTQLRPCGHMFHERCLKPSLQTPKGPPLCPVDGIPMQSALLAVPTEEIPTWQDQRD